MPMRSTPANPHKVPRAVLPECRAATTMGEWSNRIRYPSELTRPPVSRIRLCSRPLLGSDEKLDLISLVDRFGLAARAR